MVVSPRCFSVYHFASYLLCGYCNIARINVQVYWPGYALGTVYCMFALVSTVSIAINEGFFAFAGLCRLFIS